MNANLQSLLDTTLRLGGVVHLDGYGYLRDNEVRYIAQEGINAGYETLQDIPDDWAVAKLIARSVQSKKTEQKRLEL